MNQSISQFLKFNYWIFDLDGTLTIAQHNFEEIRQKLGLPASLGILEAIASKPEQQRILLTEKLDQMELLLAQKAKPQPGAIGLIKGLHARGAKLAILTRNSRANADAALASFGIAELFDPEAILGRENCAAKPSADGIELMLRRWRAPSAETVMVGDYLYDLQAGRAASVSTIHFCLDQSRVWPEFTDFRVSSLQRLLVD